MEDLRMKAASVLRSLNMPGHIEDLPEVPVHCLRLRGRRVLFIDDSLPILVAFVVPLLMATEGSATFLLHTTQSAEELLSGIRGMKPEIVLLDEYLARGVRGHCIARDLVQSDASLRVLGFSNSEKDAVFREAGALGAVLKDTDDPFGSLGRVVDALA